MSMRDSIPDPVRDGIARGWKVFDAATFDSDRRFEADVIIVGSGAGGGISAEVLANSGLSVIIVEEGPLKTSRDFRMREADAYAQLYQESAARKTADKGITILQGRAVGGSTTINWTSSFRTPEATLAWWQREHGLPFATGEAMAPWFAQVERRLKVASWEGAPNANNAILQRGAAKLGISSAIIPRNVHGCWNLGYCGMGCPVNAKQSMLVTTIPAALAQGATLISRARAEHLVLRGDRVEELVCTALDEGGVVPTGRVLRITARHVVLAGGAINTPALLLRSRAPDPSGQLGRRTFLHPTLVSAARFDERVDGWDGAPQSVYSDHFLAGQPIDGPLGYKLEVPPLHPLLLATTMPGFGEGHAAAMHDFPHLSAMLALLRDGFHPESTGGRVRVRGDGSAELDYPLGELEWDGARRALLTMAELQFAAGARSVQPVHELARAYTSWGEARREIAALPQRLHHTRVVSAHVMGGCAFGGNEKTSVTNPEGRYRGIANLSVHDGSLLPTSIGANPQLTIYALAARLASRLAQQLTNRAPAPLA